MPKRPPVHHPPGIAAAKKRETKEHDRLRGSAAARGYGKRWQRIRAGHLKREPVCRSCLARGVINAGTKGAPLEVDHITPRSQGGSDDDSNLQSLCKPCHSAKTLAEQRMGRGGGNLQGRPGGDPRPTSISTWPFQNSGV